MGAVLARSLRQQDEVLFHFSAGVHQPGDGRSWPLVNWLHGHWLWRLRRLRWSWVCWLRWVWSWIWRLWRLRLWWIWGWLWHRGHCPWMVAMPGLVDMWLQILGRSTLQRGLLSQRQNPNMQLDTLAWVGTGLGSEATLPWDTLCLLTLPWATPPATQGDMGFTTATEATVDSTEAATMAKQIINSSHSIQFYKEVELT